MTNACLPCLVTLGLNLILMFVNEVISVLFRIFIRSRNERVAMRSMLSWRLPSEVMFSTKMMMKRTSTMRLSKAVQKQLSPLASCLSFFVLFCFRELCCHKLGVVYMIFSQLCVQQWPLLSLMRYRHHILILCSFVCPDSLFLFVRFSCTGTFSPDREGSSNTEATSKATQGTEADDTQTPNNPSNTTNLSSSMNSGGSLFSEGTMSLFGDSQPASTMNELLQVCSGSFQGASGQGGSSPRQLWQGDSQPPSTMSQLLNVCSGSFATQKETSEESHEQRVLSDDSQPPSTMRELLQMCSGSFETQGHSQGQSSGRHKTTNTTSGPSAEAMSELIGLCSGQFGEEPSPTQQPPATSSFNPAALDECANMEMPSFGNTHHDGEDSSSSDDEELPVLRVAKRRRPKSG